jgi:hypothetical protein
MNQASLEWLKKRIEIPESDLFSIGGGHDQKLSCYMVTRVKR